MNRFRRSLCHRLLALVVLVGIGTWVSAPLAASQSQAVAAQVAQTYAAGPLEQAVAKAMAAAARSDSTPETFAQALNAALEAHPEGKALAAFLAAEYSPELLLDILVGHLLRSKSVPLPHLIASASMQVAPTGGATTIAVHHETVGVHPVSFGADASNSYGAPPVPSIRILSSAQPLGP